MQTSPTSRLSLQHLLRDPENKITLAPAYTPEQAPSPLGNTISNASLDKSTLGRSGATLAGINEDRVPRRESGEARAGNGSGKSINETKAGSSKSKKESKRPNPSMGTSDLNSGSGWGFPPPSPYQSYHDGGNGESSMSGRRGPGSPGAMSIYSQASESGGKKRRRESEIGYGSVEPEVDDDGRGGARPLAITCAPCRTRKVKCDSKKPVCANCSKTPTECFYPVKQKPGLRPGTGTDMAKRIENLEERIQSYEIRLSDQETRLTQVQYATSAGNLRSSMNQGTDTLSNMAMEQIQASTPLDLPYSSAVAPNPNIDYASFASPSGISSHSFRDPNILPPDDIVRDLISLFFTFIHPWAPILSPTLPTLAAPWSIVVHAIVVVSLRYSNDPRLPPSTQATYRQAAKQHVLSHAIESTSISSVQALALLALDLIGSEQGPSAWGLLALLTRSAVHLGLAKEDDTPGQGIGGRAPAPSLSRTSIIPPATNWGDDEARRRLFWLIFCLDRYACVSTGWDFAIPDFEVKRRLPCSDEIWGGQQWFMTPYFRPVHLRVSNTETSPLSPLAHLVEALDLLGRAHTLQAAVIEPGDARAIQVRKEMTLTLSDAARKWFSSIQERTRRERQDGLTLMIQAIHHATLLKLNAYYAYPALATGEPIEPHTSTCLNAAQSIVDLIHTARTVGWMTASTPFFIWGCWVAARVLFVHAFTSHQMGPDEAFDEIVGCLREQAGYWGLAKQYVKLLERAKRKWLASMPPSSDPPNPSLPDAIHVLLDLRRTAYSSLTTNTQETPHVSPPDVDLSHLPAWAVQPLLGDLHGWFDLPAGLFQGDL